MPKSNVQIHSIITPKIQFLFNSPRRKTFRYRICPHNDPYCVNIDRKIDGTLEYIMTCRLVLLQILKLFNSFKTTTTKFKHFVSFSFIVLEFSIDLLSALYNLRIIPIKSIKFIHNPI